MTSRERVLAAINHQPVDRVPCDIWLTPEIRQALLEHFQTEDWGVVSEQLGIDGYAGVGAAYAGPPFTTPEGQPAGLWGIRQTKEIKLPTGGTYFEYVSPPLAEFTEVAQVEDYNWGNPADFDFAAAGRQARELHDQQVVMGGYICPYVDLWDLFGVERALLNIALRPKLIEAVLEKTMTFRLEQHRLLFEACEGYLDLANITDDFGSQNGLIMSHQTIRDLFWPWYREATALAHKHGLKVFHHDDGGCEDLLPDLIEMGVAVLNPVQYRCMKIDLETLKREYGKDLCFHGSVENQEIIPFGTAEQVREEVRKNIRILASDGTGLIIGPCHNIQSGTPLANVLAMYDEIREAGRM